MGPPPRQAGLLDQVPHQPHALGLPVLVPRRVRRGPHQVFSVIRHGQLPGGLRRGRPRGPAVAEATDRDLWELLLREVVPSLAPYRSPSPPPPRTRAPRPRSAEKSAETPAAPDIFLQRECPRVAVHRV